MAVVIRLKRTGRKNRPSYRISATDSRSARDGRTLETLGHYDPASPVEVLRLRLDAERVKHWLALGAAPSETVASILRQQGVVRERTARVRDRSGRKKPSRTKARRAERKKTRLAAKQERHEQRLKARRAAAKAAATPAEGGSTAPA
jgi:small subunit ribosomal protein S16